MSKHTKTIPPSLQAWIQARKRHRLSHAQVQMARELGMNPTKLGSIDNHRQEPWKAPLPEFIQRLYLKRFGHDQPEVVVSIEERARQLQRQNAGRKAAKAQTALRQHGHARRAVTSSTAPSHYIRLGPDHAATGFAMHQYSSAGTPAPRGRIGFPDVRQSA